MLSSCYRIFDTLLQAYHPRNILMRSGWGTLFRKRVCKPCDKMLPKSGDHPKR